MLKILGMINFCLVQWFFARIFIRFDEGTNTAEGLGLLFPVIPLTGWLGSFLPEKYYPKNFKVIKII